MNVVVIVLAVVFCAWLLRAMARAASKPRRTPKIPRDRRLDTQIQPVIWFRLF